MFPASMGGCRIFWHWTYCDSSHSHGMEKCWVLQLVSPLLSPDTVHNPQNALKCTNTKLIIINDYAVYKV